MIPALERLIASHPPIRGAVSEVLEAADEVRRARPAALPPGAPPATIDSHEKREAKARLITAAAAMERLANTASRVPDEIPDVIHRVMSAIVDLRVLGHCFSPPRAVGGVAERTVLIKAIRRYTGALDRLRRQARAVGVTRLPWQIEFATHIEPGTPVGEIELDGYGLPGTPVATRAWGERCVLTGEAFDIDNHREPVIRYRSLDSCSTALSPEAWRLATRIREAAASLARTDPSAIRPLFDLAPWLAETHVPCGSNPTLTRLGLLDFPSLAVMTNNLLRSFADLPFLGTRGPEGEFRGIGTPGNADGVPSGSDQDYGWTTYNEIRDRALGLAYGLESLDLPPKSRIGIVASRNCVEFLVTDLACVFSNRTSVGLLDTINDETLISIVRSSGIKTVVADRQSAKLFINEKIKKNCPELSTLIVYGSPDDSQRVDGEHLRVLTLDTIERPPTSIPDTWTSASGIGPSTPVIHDDEQGATFARSHGMTEDGDDDVFTIVFTSGTTNRPKGVVITRRQWANGMRAETWIWPHVEVSYLPSALAADRTIIWRNMASGGRVGFSGRGAGLLADIEALRPTILEAPPAMLNAFYGEFRLAAGDPDLDRAELAAIRRRMRGNLGGRLGFLGTGGAASEPLVRETLGEVLGLKITEGYGTTETGNIATLGRIRPEVDFRLVDVPDMGFTSRDKPFPRGELVVRTPRTTTQYIAALETDSGSFTDDGYFQTGDIVELEGNRRIRIIGRRKQFFKLAGAEFVYPDLLERHFMRSDLVRALLVTGLPTARSIVAVVVSARDGIGTEEIAADLRLIAHREGLRPFEVPVGVVVELPIDGELPWTTANGLLTPSHKLCRRAIESHYAAQIREIYDRAGADGTLAPVEPNVGSGRHEDLIRHLVANLLQLHPDEVEMEHSFSDHGGESLAAMELVLRLRLLLPPSEAQSRTSDTAKLTETPLAEVASWIAGTPTSPARSTSAPNENLISRPPPVSVEAKSIEHDDAQVANADAAWCDLPDELPPQSEADGIFLTGATGFLGIHMVAELAASLEPGQQLFALVRAEDDEGARRRLEQALSRAGLKSPAVGAGATESSPIIALAGSLEHDRFGLETAVYQRLCTEIGLIHHVGASVTFEQGYGGLREPNVHGTRRVLQLATEGQLKALHFVSSLNVAHLLESCGIRPALEISRLPTVLPAKTVAGSSGYAVSKWASERMVQGMYHASAGHLRFSVSRPALITWSTSTGFANESDWFSRLLLSCLQMRCAIGQAEAGVPRWAPLTEATARGLDLVPVDYTARAICRLGELTRTGALQPGTQAPTFHVSNLAPAEKGLITVEHLMDMLVASDLSHSSPGAGFSFTPLPDWLLRVEAEGAPALPILPMLARMNPALPRTKADRFAEIMAEPGGPFAARCPAFDQTVVDTFVQRIRRMDQTINA